MEIVEADLTLVGDRFESGAQVEVSTDGTIHRAGKLGLAPTTRLGRRALLPGMVNAHSHAFQRGLRGRGEVFPAGSGSFWSWREEMYALVERLDAERFHAICVQCFSEMLHAGITSVGEFHYLHHDETCDGYAFDDLVLSAARQVGIRIVLLSACYLSGDIDAPLQPAQRRFGSRSVEAFLDHVAGVDAKTDGDLQRQGLVAHSIRAVGIDDIARLHESALQGGKVLHMHVEEQRREIEACCRFYRKRPMELLLDRLELGQEFTAVHCTHTDPNDITRFIEAGGNVCICPLTEANLGDGVCDAPQIWSRGGNVCLGSDSNARIDFLEEMRLLEYGQRLVREGRGMLLSSDGSGATGLWRAAAEGGARALNLPCGKIETGALADLIAVDLDAPSLTGWTPETLLASMIFGCDGRIVDRVCVGGRWVV